MTTPVNLIRDAVQKMHGYTPGEQPKVVGRLIKLNTNENPYPPCPAVCNALRDFDTSMLRLYPDPVCAKLCECIASLNGLSAKQVIAGNGSDDILTIAIRTFLDDGDALACFDPTYSLYPILADIQGVTCRNIPLTNDFQMPPDTMDYLAECRLLFLTRPNAPTGNCYPLRIVSKLCRDFQGIVFVDEAYGEFAGDSCATLIGECKNVIVSRTLSKSYSLAGIRLGYAMGHEDLIAGMFKVKDSYNVNMLTQHLGLLALQDQSYLQNTVCMIKATRERVSGTLQNLGFHVIPSEANFILASPPDRNGQAYFEHLRKGNIIVRYFPGPRTGEYVRISVGTDDDMNELLSLTESLY